MPLSEAETKLNKYLDSLYAEGSAHRATASKTWDNAIKVIRGNTWPDRRPKYKVNAVMNFLSQIVERKAALLTDSRPTISITSRKAKDDPLCDLLQKTIEGILEEKNFEQKVTEFVMLEEYFGFALFNTCFDQNLDYGKGDIDLVVIDPRCFIFDPFVTRSWNLQHGEYCCLETVRPTELLCETYKARRDDIKADISTGTTRPDSLVHKLRQLFQFDKDFPNQKTSVIPRSIVRDWWVRDRTTRIGENLRYPNWRHILIAGGVPVEDGTNPYIDGNLPFDGMEWGFNVDSAYGTNEIDQLETPQIMFNKVLASILENAILMGNGIWVGDRDALSEEGWKKLSNEPGSHVRVRPGKTIRRDTPPSLPSYIMQAAEMMVSGIEKLSGITEVTEGRRPGQVTSGVAIESLAIMAQTTIRLKARQIEGLIQRMGQKLIPRIFAYYTSDRVFNLIGEKGGFQQYVFEREKIRKVIKERGMSAFQDYQFRVVPASSLAMTKWQKGLVATQLFQMGAIDQEALLESMEFAGREQILERMMGQSQTIPMEVVAAAIKGNPNEQDIVKKIMIGMQSSQKGKKGSGGGAPEKLPSTLLRGAHRETGMQEPQMGK